MTWRLRRPGRGPLLLALVLPALAVAGPRSIKEMSLEELMATEVETASGLEESLVDAPAAMVTIDAAEIERRGYVGLDEVLADLPGFDVVEADGTLRLVAYQRGYRTTWTMRTLLLINGVEDNHLWNHVALLSRQYPLSDIERIEVLYGPASAVYGPNAFLGIINIITRQPEDVTADGEYLTANVQYGEHDTHGVDLAAGGRKGELGFTLSAKLYQSDGAGLDDYGPEWGYLDEDLLGNETIWGPVVDNDGAGPMQVSGEDLGTYGNRTDDYGLVGNVSFRDFKLGLIHWRTREGYGPYYALDRVQPNAFWEHRSSQLYLEHDGMVSPRLGVRTRLLYRTNRVGGDWVEATPVDADDSVDSPSWVSYSDWAADARSWRFNQDYRFTLSERLRVNGGVKFERKRLTENYVICGYWPSALCPEESPAEEADNVARTDDPDASLAYPPSADDIPGDNHSWTTDKGVYLQGIWNLDEYRVNAGVRWDENSDYGSSINPRIAVIYKPSPDFAVKAIYGEAFQEPAPLHLYGGWTGRAANPDLEPEKARNGEIIVMFATGPFVHDVSLYRSHYEQVNIIGQNAGERDVMGAEYRGRFSLPSGFLSSRPITGNLYYTYTDPEASMHYDQGLAEWVKGDVVLGDIARHKANAIVNLPVGERWNLNLRGQWVGERRLFSRNPLRAAGRETDAYWVVHGHLRWAGERFAVGLKVDNIFDREYFHPGVENADSGSGFTGRSQGFMNSLIPQEGRRYMLLFQARL